LGEVFHELAEQRGCKMVEGHLMPDQVHMYISIPPKYSVSSVVGYLKGKSAIAIARRFGGRKRNFIGEVFWARGYFVSTVGLDEALPNFHWHLCPGAFENKSDSRLFSICRGSGRIWLCPTTLLSDVIYGRPEHARFLRRK
jgi:hypothetical protein